MPTFKHSPKKTRKKIFLSLLLFFLFPLILTGCKPKKLRTLTKPSELVSLDDVWNQYTNYDLGFSLKIPKQSNNHYGACKWKGDEGDQSYRLVSQMTPIKVFEHEKGVFIDHEYQNQLTGETVEPEGRTSYGGCEKQTNSVTTLQNQEAPHTWDINVESVPDETALTAFIQKRFGSGCQMGEKTETDQAGVFKVEVKGDNLPPMQSQCFLNYAYVLLYIPEQNKVITWNLGQNETFYTSDWQNSYDAEMRESFKILF
jgi:hypothetical protein